MKKILGVAFLIGILDQGIKWLILHTMSLAESIQVIQNFFYLTYVKNTGAAWSLLAGKTVFFILCAAIMMFVFYYYFIRNKKQTKFEILCYGLIYGGIIGNVIDRIIHGAVIDYLDFCILDYDFPIFNLADIAIVMGGILLVWITCKEEKRCKHIS